MDLIDNELRIIFEDGRSPRSALAQIIPYFTIAIGRRRKKKNSRSLQNEELRQLQRTTTYSKQQDQLHHRAIEFSQSLNGLDRKN